MRIFAHQDDALDPNTLTNWKVAKKIKAVRAKPIVSILVDKGVLSKLLITTLEANEPLGDGAVICIGEAGDIWQQMPKKLLAKYTVESIDVDGWMVCEPKPDNSVECCEIEGHIDSPTSEHYVKAAWGESFKGMTAQRFTVGDFICRNRNDHNDVWVVRRKFFQNTYTIIAE